MLSSLPEHAISLLTQGDPIAARVPDDDLFQRWLLIWPQEDHHGQASGWEADALNERSVNGYWITCFGLYPDVDYENYDVDGSYFKYYEWAVVNSLRDVENIARKWLPDLASLSRLGDTECWIFPEH